MPTAPEPRPVLFDLLTALLDSWSLWNRVAGSEDAGRRWRHEYLRITYGAGSYRPYETLVAEAAAATGLSPSAPGGLLDAWDELEPWPDANEVLDSLARHGPIGVVTNCSNELARRAVARFGVRFDVVVTAEEAGAYKPDPRPYLLARDRLAVPASRIAFVAGSPFDLGGATSVGFAVFWHNRLGLTAPPGAPAAIAERRTLTDLLPFLRSEAAEAES